MVYDKLIDVKKKIRVWNEIAKIERFFAITAQQAPYFDLLNTYAMLVYFKQLARIGGKKIEGRREAPLKLFFVIFCDRREDLITEVLHIGTLLLKPILEVCNLLD